MQSAVERRQEIIEYLCECRTTNVIKLCRKFDVSRSTILRDLSYLTCSYPIFTQQGNGGSVYIQEGYFLHKEYLSTEQQDYLEKLIINSDEKEIEIINSIIERFGRIK